MSVQAAKPLKTAGVDDKSFRDDNNSGGWLGTDGFQVGEEGASQVMAASGFASAEMDVGLQAIAPNDYASVRVFVGNVLNLSAFANASASGTVASAASGQGSVTVANGTLSGLFSATLNIDVTAYIAADQATVHMHISDSFEMSLAGTGYAGASLAETVASGGSVQVMAPVAATTACNTQNHSGEDKTGTFDLARFATSVLNTGQWNIAFAASAPGESLKGEGLSVLTISATADLAGNHRPKVLSFHDIERAKLAFSDSSTPVAGIHPGMLQSSSGPPSMFHNG